MNAKAKQNGYLHYLIKRHNVGDETKEELVHTFTNGRETSSSKMSYDERQKMINHLQSLGKPTDDPANKMRRKILSICHDMAWETESGQIDWPRLNNYLSKYGYLHKPLNDYTTAELPTLVSQFEKMQRDAAKKI